MGGENTTTPRPSSEGKEAPGPAATRPWHRPRGRPPPRLPAGEAFPRPGPSEGHRRQREAPSRERRRLFAAPDPCVTSQTRPGAPPRWLSFSSTAGAAIPRLPDDAPSFFSPPPRHGPVPPPPLQRGRGGFTAPLPGPTAPHNTPPRAAFPPPPSPTEKAIFGPRRGAATRPAPSSFAQVRGGGGRGGGAAV